MNKNVKHFARESAILLILTCLTSYWGINWFFELEAKKWWICFSFELIQQEIVVMGQIVDLGHPVNTLS